MNPSKVAGVLQINHRAGRVQDSVGAFCIRHEGGVCRLMSHSKRRNIIGLPILLAMLFANCVGPASPVLAQSSLRSGSEASDDAAIFAPPATSYGYGNTGNTVSADVVIYGATPSGIMAAIEAARLGRQVILLEPTLHIGGMMSNGLGATDQYSNDDFGGLAAQFFQEVNNYYNQIPSAAYGYEFEPHVAEAEFNSMLARYANISVVLDTEFSSAAMNGTTITGLTASSGVTYLAKQFIDASYTGDLMAAAGVSYRVGRESSGEYNEPTAGVGVLAPVASSPIDPYVTPGDPSSGLIAHVSAKTLRAAGSADSAVMAYNYRLCVTTDPNNQIPFMEPANYDPSEFAILTRMFASPTPLPASDVVSGIGLLSIGGLPNSKFDLNDGGTYPIMGTDEVGESFAYPDGSSTIRREIEAEQKRYMQALLYFLSNDSSVPQSAQAAVKALGLCKDEFTDNGGWPHQIYVREARRMIGQYVLTLSDLERKTTVPDSIGLGGYPVDSHPVHIVNVNGAVEYEPAPVGQPTVVEYQLPYRILTPNADQVTNLLVSVDVSTSHVAYDSVRVEPTYMILGQAAGAAASIAIGQGTTVQSVPYSTLASQLLDDGLVLSVPLLSAKSLAFETQPVGTASNSQFVSLTNNSTAPLSITGFQVTGANASSFVFAKTCGNSLAAGASCTIHGHFTPVALGPMTAAITVSDSAAGSPQSIALTGTGVSPTVMAVSSGNLSFGTIGVGRTSSSRFVALMNTGTSSQTISGITLTGSNASSFVFANSCGPTLASGTSCTIHGHFAPAGSGTATATLTIASSATNSPQTITLTGRGVESTGLVLSATGLSYGAVGVGTTSASQGVTLTNTSNSTLAVSSITVTGANAASFVFTNNCGSSLAPGANCTIHGHFAPTAAGAQTATVSITDSATGSPQTITVDGSGN